MSVFILFQEKITKEMNYILSNQETVLTQITQLESAITQTEVCKHLVNISIKFMLLSLLYIVDRWPLWLMLHEVRFIGFRIQTCTMKLYK